MRTRSQRTPFTLTAYEEQLLALYDAGERSRALRRQQRALYVALEKRRTAIGWEMDQDKKGFTSLSKAHGEVRMIGTK